MVNFRFYDYNNDFIETIDSGDDIPDKARSLHIDGPFDHNMINCRLLTRMLEGSSKKIEHVTIESISAESPEALSFLVLVCNKAISLEVAACRFSTNAMSCFMATLLTQGGIRSLTYWTTASTHMATDRAMLLFQGIACSPCLESLKIRIDFDDPHDIVVGNCLIQALRRNQSLKEISVRLDSISSNDSTFLPNLLKALGPNIRTARIQATEPRDLQLEVLQEVVCRKDCTLETLDLHGIDILTENGGGSIIQNTSVSNLRVTCCNLESGELAKIIRLFKSLEELDLKGNSITDLAFLDPLLLGERSRLKCLDVSRLLHEVSNEETGLFIDKLRNSRCLKHLTVFGVDDCEESVYTKLNDVLQKNTDLEYIDHEDAFFVDLNRGGRRAFESSQPFPRNLLPRVLERASKLLYYERCDTDYAFCGDRWGDPRNEEIRADVVFWMVQRIILES